jgi:hypothetical protein
MPQPAGETSPNLLLNVVVAFLAPMFLWSTGGNVTFAQLAAIETLDAYRATGPFSLITAARIIAFELAALSSLSQSMAEDLSLSMVLRLRGNANSMDRAAERNRRRLEQDCRIAEAELPGEASAAEAVAEAQRMVQEANARIQVAQQPQAPAPVAAARAPMPEEQRRTAWAGAMAQVAGELTADMAKLPPKQREAEMMRVEALTQTAAALVSGAPVPAFPPGR